MSSPRLNVGEHGTVTYTRTANGWVARTRYRCIDGVVRPRQATGRTKQEAQVALQRLTVGPPPGAGEYVTAQSTLMELAVAWLEDLRLQEEVSAETYDYYRRGVETIIIPGIGGYRLEELRPVAIKHFYQRLLFLEDNDGNQVRRSSRPVWAHKVLSLMLRYAIEIGAIDESPVRTLRPPKRNRPDVRVLSVEQFHDIRAAVAEFDERPARGPKRSHRLLDVFDLLAATGARVSEVLALRWMDVDLDAHPAQVTINGTLLPPRDGLPVRRKDGTKTPAAMRTITIPDFAADTLRRLRAAADMPSADAPVFVTKVGTWLSPNNVRREWRQCRSEHDWDWITPHTFRKTVATLIDDHYSDPENGGTEGAGAPIAAAVLGHSSETVTRTYYIKKMRQAPDVSAVLQRTFDQARSTG